MPVIGQFGEIPFRPLGDDNLARFPNVREAPFIMHTVNRHIVAPAQIYCIPESVPSLDFIISFNENTEEDTRKRR